MKLYAQERPEAFREIVAIISDGRLSPFITVGQLMVYNDGSTMMEVFSPHGGFLSNRVKPAYDIVAWEYVSDALPEFVKLRDKLTDEFYKEKGAKIENDNA